MRTVVTEENLNEVMLKIVNQRIIAIDTETTGLRPYNGDILFSIIVSTTDNDFYFNFNEYPDVKPLPDDVFSKLARILRDKEIILANAKFDMAMLEKEGIVLEGKIHDILALDRLKQNDEFQYGLDAVAGRCGLAKSDAVEEYIKEHKLWEWKLVPGTSRRTKDKSYNEVPFEVISEYGLNDGRITFDCYKHLCRFFGETALSTPDGLPSILQVVENEVRLTTTLYNMERVGVKTDFGYCKDAESYYREKIESVCTEFKSLTGHEFSKGTNLFKEIFADEEWKFTEKGNPKFDADTLATFKHPAAKLVVDYAEAKKQLEYFEGFLYHMDDSGIIHPDYQQGGTATGRLSCKNPNLQNLTKPDKYEKSEDTEADFPVRRAFVPREGYFFAMLDFDQMEYRMMLDIARAHGLIEKVLGGLDVHQATADVAGIGRYEAKTVNFSVLYGAGINSLAASLGVSKTRATEIRDSIFRAAPEIRNFIRGVTRTAERRGFIFNWMGRRSHFRDANFAYKAPNYLIQGGCADVVKVAMNHLDHYLKPMKSRMLMQIHDEIVFEIHESEAYIIKDLKMVMENVYPHKKLPLTVGADFSFKSLADKEPLENLQSGHGYKTRDEIQEQDPAFAGGTAELLGGENSTGIH